MPSRRERTKTTRSRSLTPTVARNPVSHSRSSLSPDFSITNSESNNKNQFNKSRQDCLSSTNLKKIISTVPRLGSKTEDTKIFTIKENIKKQPVINEFEHRSLSTLNHVRPSAVANELPSKAEPIDEQDSMFKKKERNRNSDEIKNLKLDAPVSSQRRFTSVSS